VYFVENPLRDLSTKEENKAKKTKTPGSTFITLGETKSLASMEDKKDTVIN